MAGNRHLLVLFDGCVVIISLVIAAAPFLPLGFISCSRIISPVQRKAKTATFLKAGKWDKGK